MHRHSFVGYGGNITMLLSQLSSYFIVVVVAVVNFDSEKNNKLEGTT